MALSSIILDLETTGFSPKYNAIIEVAAIKIEGYEEVDRFHTLINPHTPLPPFIQDLTGLTDKDLRGEPLFSDISTKLISFIGSCPIIAHNSSFDKRFLVAADKRFNRFIYKDYLSYVRKIRKSYKSHSLEKICEYLSIEIEAHRALGDVLALFEVIKLLGYPK